MTDRVSAWHPPVPALREAYHANFDHAYPVHTHDDWTVLLVDRGVVAYALDGVEHHAGPAALSLLPPGVPHDGRPATAGENYRKRVLYFEADWLPGWAGGAAAGDPTLRDAGTLRVVHAMHAALAAPGDLMAAEQDAIILRERILRHLDRPAHAARDTPLARRLRELLDSRYTEPLTITAIAAELAVHPSHLVRVFTQSYGIPPHQYLVSRRVDHARRLLVDGHRPADVAARAGFHDQSHLTRHFRRILGTTPSSFAA